MRFWKVLLACLMLLPIAVQAQDQALNRAADPILGSFSAPDSETETAVSLFATAGGVVELDQADLDCDGYTTIAPTLTLIVSETHPLLRLYFEGEDDVYLLLAALEGDTHYCSDSGDPLDITDLAPGEYGLWLASEDEDEFIFGRLWTFVEELEPANVIPAPDTPLLSEDDTVRQTVLSKVLQAPLPLLFDAQEQLFDGSTPDTFDNLRDDIDDFRDKVNDGIEDALEDGSFEQSDLDEIAQDALNLSAQLETAANSFSSEGRTLVLRASDALQRLFDLSPSAVQGIIFIETGGSDGENGTGSAQVTPVTLPTATAGGLRVGGQAQVTPALGELNVRAAAGTGAALVGRLRRGGCVSIIDGPRSANGYVWWRVQASGLDGWAAEASTSGQRWLAEPATPCVTPPTIPLPTATGVVAAATPATPVPTVPGATAVPTTAAVLNFSLPANYGSTTLNSGFVPDPFTVGVVSGGSINVQEAGLPSGCRGFVTSAPDYELRWNGSGSTRLRIYVVGGGDTTLIVNTATASWACNDDSAGTTSPTVDIPNAPSGTYDIWVGTFSQGGGASVSLRFTELDYDPSNPGG